MISLRKFFSQEGSSGNLPKDFKTEKNLAESGIEIKGKADPKVKDIVRKNLEDVKSGKISTEDLEAVRKVEYEKSPEILHAIELANDYLRQLKAEFGLRHTDIDPANIHLLTRENADKVGVRGSCHDVDGYMYIVKSIDKEPDIWIAREIFHEMLHDVSFRSLDIEQEGQSVKYHERRSGIETRTPQDEQLYKFKGLNEAVIEDITDDFYERVLLKSGLFRKEIKTHKKIIKKRGLESFPKVNPEYSFIVGPTKNKNIDFDMQSGYNQHRDLMGYIIKKISETNPEKYPQPGDVKQMLRRSLIRGNLVDLSKALVQTFGREGFERIKHCDYSKQSAVDTLQYLHSREALVKT